MYMILRFLFILLKVLQFVFYTFDSRTFFYRFAVTLATSSLSFFHNTIRFKSQGVYYTSAQNEARGLLLVFSPALTKMLSQFCLNKCPTSLELAFLLLCCSLQSSFRLSLLKFVHRLFVYSTCSRLQIHIPISTICHSQPSQQSVTDTKKKPSYLFQY